MTKANSDELEEAVNWGEEWVWRFGGLLLVGLVGEVVIAIIHPPYECWLERWGTVAMNVLVAIGVGGEVLAGKIASICQGEQLHRADTALQAALALGNAALEQADHATNEAAVANARVKANLIGGGQA